MSKTTAPYGTWDSPIVPATITSDANLVFDDVLVDSVTKKIYYLQEEPSTGRCLVMEATKPPTSVLPAPYSARTLVQEYGGAPAIVYNDVVYFSYYNGNPSDPDNRIYKFKIGDTNATPLTPANTLYRYANFVIHPTQTNLLVTLREDHTDDPNGDNPAKVINTICVVDTTSATANVNVVISGAGFYAFPAFDSSGDKIAWQEWNLPWMPWQGGAVKYAPVTPNPTTLTVDLTHQVLVAGDPVKGTVSAAFPCWVNDTTLAYISDRGKNRYLNPYICDTGTGKSTLALAEELDQDFCEPEWVLGLYPYAILGLDEKKYGVFTAFENGRNILYVINLTAPKFDRTQINPFDFTVAQHVRTVSESKNTFVFTGSQSTAPGGIVLGTVSDDHLSVTFDVLEYSGDPKSPLLQYVSKPNPMTFTSGSNKIYAIRYDPQNPNYSGPAGEYPPCIIGVHGGPTALEPQALNWTKMFFTSRGFAWQVFLVDVNYRGSSGYGRNYSDLLYGNWGRYDVQDCHEVAVQLAKSSGSTSQYINGNEVAIRGGSAGAYTTLVSVTFAPLEIREFYKSASGVYGCVADVVKLTTSSEKFELGYTAELLGPDQSQWQNYNPINFAKNIQVPLLVMQGANDGVVPPAELRSFLGQSADYAPSGEYVFYPDEGHHFVQGPHIRNALSREFHWYLDNLLPA